MGHKITKLDSKGQPCEFRNKAFVRFDHIYIIEEHCPEFILDTTWQVQIAKNGKIEVLPTKETKEILDERNIIVSFWASAVLSRIEESIRLEIQPHLTDENGENVIIFDDSNQYWNKPGATATIVVVPKESK